LCEDPLTVEYKDNAGVRQRICGGFLVGADGKAGVVRKRFLEPVAGIRQVEGTYRYSGTWIAANLRIRLPTPQTHPDFPLWRLGYTPQNVYEAFWPDGWHFCCPPGEATAAGHFGPHAERLWRHEWRIRDEDADGARDNAGNANGNVDATADRWEIMLWNTLTPMITRSSDGQGRSFHCGPLTYPKDCIEVLRCRPYRFVHKVVNQRFHQRMILVGDSAAIYPPFAGQGIASGLRDAHQLAWRLAMIVRASGPKVASAVDTNGTGKQNLAETRLLDSNILSAWATERRKSVDDAALLSKQNGVLVNSAPPAAVVIVLTVLQYVRLLASYLPRYISQRLAYLDPQGRHEQGGFTGVDGGFFLSEHGGGVKLAQICVQSSAGGPPILSDRLLQRPGPLFTLLVIVSHIREFHNAYWGARKAIDAADIDPSVLSHDSIVVFCPSPGSSTWEWPASETQVYAPAPSDCFPPDVRSHDDRWYMDRLGWRTRYAIVRPDSFVYARIKGLEALEQCLASLREATT
jgi:hypothetical protein